MKYDDAVKTSEAGTLRTEELVQGSFLGFSNSTYVENPIA